MALSCQLAYFAGFISVGELDRIMTVLDNIGLPIWDPVCDGELLWNRLRDDVLPHKGGHLHLVVPAGIGAGDFIDSLASIGPDLLTRACTDLRTRLAKVED
jgi:hypothetical protein